jgi:hypothetical protein
MGGMLGGQLRWWAVAQGATQVRGMKVRASVKKLCEGCKVGFFFSQVDFLVWLRIGPDGVLSIGSGKEDCVDDVKMLI